MLYTRIASLKEALESTVLHRARHTFRGESGTLRLKLESREQYTPRVNRTLKKKAAEIVLQLQTSLNKKASAIYSLLHETLMKYPCEKYQIETIADKFIDRLGINEAEASELWQALHIRELLEDLILFYTLEKYTGQAVDDVLTRAKILGSYTNMFFDRAVDNKKDFAESTLLAGNIYPVYTTLVSAIRKSCILPEQLTFDFVSFHEEVLSLPMSDYSIVDSVFEPLFAQLLLPLLAHLPPHESNYPALTTDMLEQYPAHTAQEKHIIAECLRKKTPIWDTTPFAALMDLVSTTPGLSHTQRLAVLRYFYPTYVPGGFVWLTVLPRERNQKTASFRLSIDYTLPPTLQPIAQQLTADIAGHIQGKGIFHTRKDLTTLTWSFTGDFAAAKKGMRQVPPRIHYAWTPEKHSRISGKKVLIIEDNPLLQERLVKTLKTGQSNLDVSCVSSLSEAQFLLLNEETRPDIISLDIVLIDEWGTDLPLAMMQNTVPQIPIIVVSDIVGKSEITDMVRLCPSVQHILPKETLFEAPSLLYSAFIDSLLVQSTQKKQGDL